MKLNIFKAIGAVFSWLGMMILGMMGGQGKVGGKATRRFAMPGLAVFTAIKWDGFQWKDLVFLLCIPLLAMGYGVDSTLGAICNHVEWLIRLAYAVLLSLPFLFYGKLRWIITAVLFTVAFQIHAGSLGNTSWFGDFLIEDIIRYGAWGAMVLMCITWRKK